MEGALKVPSAFKMIAEQQIRDIVEEKITSTPVFLVNVKVKPGNKIEVFIDEPNHITVDTCVALSRHIESKLNRDVEDFELTVSSPGIDEGFKVFPQYQKYIGKQVSVLKADGIKVIGNLVKAAEGEIEIETKTTERKQAGKGRQTVINNVTIETNQIKETKLILPF